MEIMLKNKHCLYVIISILFFSITICNLLIELPSYITCGLGQGSRNQPEECCVLLGPGGQGPPEAAAAAAETKSASVHAPLLRRIRFTELTLGMEFGSHILCANS
jgi:hypothetical protein